uniref:Uncharacterized protein n=1 Tax=Candidatus Kentrum sp. LFY TaxID=2126342 RepID=A0A450UG67_9GAMM|nr:MAG: hypothetical protein BECKLFY1418B_GA0070995_102621 [Candidatus Kentron sp. LFY]
MARIFPSRNNERSEENRPWTLVHPVRVLARSANLILGVMHKILLREGQIDQEKEHFWMVGLDVGRRPLFIELVAIGGSYRANIKPAEAHFG